MNDMLCMNSRYNRRQSNGHWKKFLQFKPVLIPGVAVVGLESWTVEIRKDENGEEETDHVGEGELEEIDWESGGGKRAKGKEKR